MTVSSSRSSGHCRWEHSHSSTGADVPSAFSTTSINLAPALRELREAAEAIPTPEADLVTSSIAAGDCLPTGTSRIVRQEEIARLQSVDAAQEEIDFVRFCPFTYDPVKPTVCAAGLAPLQIETQAGQVNLDFSCRAPTQRSGISAIGEDFQNQFDGIGEETQRALDRTEAQVNRTDEELEDFRDEARSGIRSAFSEILGILPGGRFIRFMFFAVIAIVVVIILRLVIGIFR